MIRNGLWIQIMFDELYPFLQRSRIVTWLYVNRSLSDDLSFVVLFRNHVNSDARYSVLRFNYRLVNMNSVHAFSTMSRQKSRMNVDDRSMHGLDYLRIQNSHKTRKSYQLYNAFGKRIEQTPRKLYATFLDSNERNPIALCNFDDAGILPRRDNQNDCKPS